MGTKIYGWGKYLRYALYAWGVPAIMTVGMAVVNFIPGDHLKPGIGLNHCWFFGEFNYNNIFIIKVSSMTKEYVYKLLLDFLL